MSFVEGRVVPAAKSSRLALDVQVSVLLGEQVFVKVAGIDAQLGGAMDLSFSSLDRITSRGEIKVVKGRYRTYGVNLEIVRGRLFFAGGAIDRPTLDFLALRTIGDVRAGVTVAGTSPETGHQTLLRARHAGRRHPGVYRPRPSARQQRRTGQSR